MASFPPKKGIIRNLCAVRGNRVIAGPGKVLCPGIVVFDERSGNIVAVDSSLENIALPECAFVERIYRAEVVVAGFIDIHNHGIGSSVSNDVMRYWCDPQYTLSRLPENGTTATLATLVFCDKRRADLDACCCALEQEMKCRRPFSAILEGVHAEGPVICTRGGLPDSSLMAGGSDASFDELLDAIPSLRIMTISPSLERDRNYSRLRLLLHRGVRPSLGHDKECSEDDILGALRAAGSASRLHLTHAFNVQHFHHRDHGLANFALASKFPKLEKYNNCLPPTAEFICDFHHCSPLVISTLIEARRGEDICCITDAIAEAACGKEVVYTGRRAMSDAETVRDEHGTLWYVIYFFLSLFLYFSHVIFL